MNCEKCGEHMNPEESFQHAGQTLCEDCYMDVMTAPKACDPWAVHTAKDLAGKEFTLTPTQQKVLDLITNNGPLTAEEICKQLAINEDDFQRNFATLRHMELARGFKRGDEVCFTLFQDQEKGA
jgi:hypothetical protein